MRNIGFFSETFLACGLAVCLSADEPPLFEPSILLSEAKAEIRRLKAENERLKKRRNNSNVSCGDNRSSSMVSQQTRLIEVEATFYTPRCAGCIGITATGLDVRNTIYTPEGHRVIAVDPSIIPLGSTVQVTLENGDSFTARAEDTGGAIKGRKIDVLVATKSEAYELGRQTASVEIIDEGGR